MVRQEHRRQIVELSHSKTRRELAQMFGISLDTVDAIYKENGIVDFKRVYRKPNTRLLAQDGTGVLTGNATGV